MNLDFKDKIAVVTGGSSGIGLAATRLLLASGAHVAMCARDEARLARVASELAAGSRLLAHSCDVRDAASVTAFATAVSGWTADKGGHVDLLVNNAGEGRVSTFGDTTDEAWRVELDLKFFSQINPVRAFLPSLKRSSAPAIVVVNSLLSLQPEAHMVATSAARAGVQSLTKSLAREFASRSVTVNAVAPGFIKTDMTSDFVNNAEVSAKVLEAVPLKRFGEAADIANLTTYLCSEEAGYITGQVFNVDGGMAM